MQSRRVRNGSLRIGQRGSPAWGMLRDLVSEDRTQQATHYKLAQARAAGDVASSAELVSAAVVGWLALWLYAYAAPFFRGLAVLARACFAGDLAQAAASPRALLPPLLLLLAGLPLAALFASAAQRGFVWRKLSLRGSRPTLSQQLERHGLGHWLLAGFEFVLLAWLLVAPLARSLPGVLDAFRRDAADLLAVFGLLARALCVRAALALAVIGLGRLVYERYQRAQRLRMTPRELRDEQRETEGDPSLRAARRARARRLYAQAVLAELDRARLVIVGPGQVVALRYDADDTAPILWLKAHGEGREALLARAGALGLPVHVDAALAEQLSALEPSEAVPPSTYAALAAYLGQQRRAGAHVP